MRKVIQVAIGSTDREDSVLALCNDGTMWVVGNPLVKGGVWKRLPSIPKPTICPVCVGRRVTPSEDGDLECWRCDGEGFLDE